MSIEAMKQALEALTIWEQMYPTSTASAYRLPAITSLRQAIAEAEKQEPVAQYSDIVSDGGLDPRNQFDTHPQPKAEQEPDPFDEVQIAYGLPKTEQEPVAWMNKNGATIIHLFKTDIPEEHTEYNIPLYTHPQPNYQKGQTD